MAVLLQRLVCIHVFACMCVHVCVYCASGEKNKVEFLLTVEGSQFECIFSKVRYSSIISDAQSVQTLEEDRIVPQSKSVAGGRGREGGVPLSPLKPVDSQLHT